MDSDLLQPSIGAAAPAHPIYSQTALFVPAFFGGPVAAAVVFGINAARLRRLPQDAGWIAAGVLLVLLVPWLALRWDAQPYLRYLVRGAGVLAALAYAWRHRPHYRAQELFGVNSPSGWGVGFAALLAGMAASVAAAFVLLPR